MVDIQVKETPPDYGEDAWMYTVTIMADTAEEADDGIEHVLNEYCLEPKNVTFEKEYDGEAFVVIMSFELKPNKRASDGAWIE